MADVGDGEDLDEVHQGIRPPPAAPVSRMNRYGPLPSIRTSTRTLPSPIMGTSVELPGISARSNGLGGGPMRRTRTGSVQPV